MLEAIRITIVLVVVILYNLISKRIFHQDTSVTTVIVSCLLAMIVYTLLVYLIKRKRKR